MKVHNIFTAVPSKCKFDVFAYILQDDYRENDDVISTINAIDAIEKALCLKEHTIQVHSLHENSQVSLVQEFARIAGILSRTTLLH